MRMTTSLSLMPCGNKAAMIMCQRATAEIDLEAFIPIELLDSMALHLSSRRGNGKKIRCHGTTPDNQLRRRLSRAKNRGRQSVRRCARGGLFPGGSTKLVHLLSRATMGVYIYWALTSILGGQETIRDEWRLNTASMRQSNLQFVDRPSISFYSTPRWTISN